MDCSDVIEAVVAAQPASVFGGAAQSIDARKRRKCALAAQCWLKRNPRLADAPCRFDIVAASPAGLEWHRGAFTLDDL